MPSIPQGHRCVAKLKFLQPIEFFAEKIPENYPRAFNHIGDHIRAKRLNLGIQVQEAAKMIGVHQATLKNWEHKHVDEPGIAHWPKIIRFLGYCPYKPCATLPEKLLMYRKMEGTSQQRMARTLQIDPGTLARFEAGKQISSLSLSKVLHAISAVFGIPR